ncbi:MAG: helix-turn-helix domain-containing protein [Bacteroidota bacterium]
MKKSILLLLLYILFPLYSFSQVTHSASDSLAQYSFAQLAEKYEVTRKTNPESAKIYLNILHTKASSKKEQITAFLKMCHHEIFYGTKEKAFSYIESAYDLAKDSATIQLGYVYEKKGYYYYAKERDHDKALANYLKALAIAEKYQDKLLLIKVEHKIGALQYTLGAIDKALKSYNALYKKIETDTIPYNLRVTILKSLGNAYLRNYSFHKEQKKLLDSSAFFTQKGLQIASQKKDQKAIAYFEYLLGIAAFIKEDYTTALTHFDRSQNANNVIKVQRMLQDIYFHKGKIFLALQQSDSAIYYIKKSEPYFEDASKKLNQSSTYALLSESYELKGDFKNATKYAQLAYAYTEKLFTDNEQTKASIDQKYSLPKLEKRIHSLEETLQNTSQKKTNWYIFSLILVALLVSVYVFSRRREQRMKVHFNELIQNLETKESIPIKETKKFIVSEKKVQQILVALEKFEKGDLFLKQDCSLSFLAKNLQTNTAYLSKIINDYKSQSYTTYITNLRIQHAVNRLKNDPRFRAYTIESIAKESGFKNAKPFSRAFKKATKLYPSVFIKNLENLESL